MSVTTNPVPLPMLYRIICGEFSEMPGLQLTKPQVRRMWSLDAHTCDEVLEALENSHFLRRTLMGTYVKTGSVVDRRRG